MKLIVLTALCLTLGLEIAPGAAEPYTTSTSGMIASLTANGKNMYRVTLQGFAQVLQSENKPDITKCLERGLKSKVELKIDLAGNILACK